MVDVILLYRILSVAGDRGRILLVGDPAQLPPIGPGLTLHALAGHQRVPVTSLSEIVRQAASTGIPAAIDGVGSVPGVHFVDCEPDRLAETAIALRNSEAGQVQMISAFKGKVASGGGPVR